MGNVLNKTGQTFANSLIKAGDIDFDSKWSFSAADGNKLLGENGDDWKNYAKHHLGKDPDADPETKAAWKYPFAKNGKIYRKGVIAVEQRAAQQGDDDIAAAAKKLLDAIDAKAEQVKPKATKMQIKTAQLVAANVVPQESDYIRVPVRAISQQIVEGYWLDFSRPGVLAAAVDMLLGKTIYADHYVAVDNWVGIVESTSWDDSSYPPGINATLKIDTVKAPNISRGLISKALRSVSVGLEFEYEKSHPNMSDMEFYLSLGHDVDGEMVRWIVTKILDIYEISIVWEGADPNAKVQGDIVVPAQTQSETANQMSIRMAKTITTQTKEGNMDPKIEELQTKVDALEQEKAELVERAKLGDVYLADLRDEVVRLAGLAYSKDELPESVVKLIGDAGLDALKDLKALYQAQVDERFPLTCQDCGSTNISRRSSQEISGDKPAETVKVDEFKA